jgi:protease I
MSMTASQPLQGEKIAILAANGFREEDFTQSQRALQDLGAFVRIISLDAGLVNSWDGKAWGLNFAVDQALSSVLAVDFSMLVIPGGQRSAEKLKLTMHSKRFISGFLDYNKPVAVFDNALDLLIHVEKVDGRTVAGPEEMRDDVARAAGTWSDDAVCIDGNLLTSRRVDNENSHIVDAIVKHFTGMNEEAMSQAA